MRRFWTAILSISGAFNAVAEVELNNLFTDSMVLQRDIPAKIFGTADAGEMVTVNFDGQTKSIKADADGKWLVKLSPMDANSKPQVLKVSGAENSLTRSDILVGDLWICTGQSNMANMLKNFKTHKDSLYTELADFPGSYKNDQIRLFTVPTQAVDSETDEILESEWVICDPQSALTFSATGYFFGRHLQPEIGVPLGLIKSAYGGTAASSWLPKEIMENSPVAKKAYLDPYAIALEDFPERFERFKKKSKIWNETKKGQRPKPPMGPKDVKRPAAMYNGMIYPLHNFAIKGAIWYQGENEANSDLVEEYKTTFPLLIKTWRDRWDQGDFPFILTQLAAFKYANPNPSDTNWSRLREVQAKTLDCVENTGMALAIDLGLSNDIHPPFKNELGKRLAAQALKMAYGKTEVAQGPTFNAMKIDENKVILAFENVGAGLIAKTMETDKYGKPHQLSADKLSGFAVAGSNRKFYWATAKIVGDKIEVSAPEVSEPVAVRYAWADYPLCNLYNKDGFAAAPFRSDNWEK